MEPGGYAFREQKVRSVLEEKETSQLSDEVAVALVIRFRTLR
jgi:hypothetical protein